MILYSKGTGRFEIRSPAASVGEASCAETPLRLAITVRYSAVRRVLMRGFPRGNPAS